MQNLSPDILLQIAVALVICGLFAFLLLTHYFTYLRLCVTASTEHPYRRGERRQQNRRSDSSYDRLIIKD